MTLWLDTADCDPPHGYHEPKVQRLVEALGFVGFDPRAPALVGYPLDGRVQLLSGTHRHEACRRLGLRVPVQLRLRSDVERAWGDVSVWEKIMEAEPAGEEVSINSPLPPRPGLIRRLLWGR
jgi:hypothetical protein